MEIKISNILFGIFLTAISYMIVPTIFKLIYGSFEEKKAKKIAMWNSIIVGLIFMILTIEITNDITVWNVTPAILYNFINIFYLQLGKKEKVLKKIFNKKNSVIILTLSILLLVILLIIIFNNISFSKREKFHAYHILVEDEYTAYEVINLLDKGINFCDLAFEYSLDKENSYNCGDVGEFRVGEMVEEFELAVKKLDIYEYTGEPVLSDYGYHIILRVE